MTTTFSPTPTLQTYSYVTEWGSVGTGNSQFENPCGIAVDSSGDVYVADTGNGRIQKFTTIGGYLTQWASGPASVSSNTSPIAICESPSGNVYVADEWNDTVQEYTSSGTFVTEWGGAGNGGNGKFNFNPEAGGLGTDASGNVYVVDSTNQFVQVFSSSGSFLLQWSTLPTGGNTYDYLPISVAVSPLGYVCDAALNNNSNYVIQQFTTIGGSVSTWWSGTLPSGDIGEGNFDPVGMTADSSGNVCLVNDTNGCDCVQKFGPNGNFLAQMGSEGSAAGQFENPHDVAVDPLGNIYVVDAGNQRVEVFAPN